MASAPASEGLTFFEVSKSFAGRHAVSAFSLHVARGEVVGLLGPNGAGKSTLLRIAAGLQAPSSGRVLIDGTDLALDPRAAKRKVGFAGDQPLFYPELTPLENVRFAAELYGLPREAALGASQSALAAFALGHRAADTSGELSHGLGQSLSLARATVHSPSVLLLDEPFEGLDASRASRLVAWLRDSAARPGRAVLLSTHQLDWGLAACDRVALLDAGRLLRVTDARPQDREALARELQELGGEPHGR